jgi:glucosamine--fructose-6-phosphate aminotransferase (isomerizing)
VVDDALAERVAHGLSLLPEHIAAALGDEPLVRQAAERIVDAQDVYFIGRGLDYAVAMEGSLKLK